MTLLGQRMVAVSFIAFGFLQFIYGDFVPGRPPAWPEQIGGGLIWAYASGASFVAAGAAMFVDRYTRPATLAITVLVFAWAVTRNLPLALADANFGGAWTRLGKAVALSGGPLAIAAARRRGEQITPTLAVVGRVALAAFLIASGVQHFLFPNAVTTLIPAWIPGPLIWAYVAGVALIAGGAGFMVPQTIRIAGLSVGAMLFTWVCILHVPRALAASPAAQRNEWVAVFEALAFAGLALVVAQRSASSIRS